MEIEKRPFNAENYVNEVIQKINNLEIPSDVPDFEFEAYIGYELRGKRLVGLNGDQRQEIYNFANTSVEDALSKLLTATNSVFFYSTKKEISQEELSVSNENLGILVNRITALSLHTRRITGHELEIEKQIESSTANSAEMNTDDLMTKEELTSSELSEIPTEKANYQIEYCPNPYLYGDERSRLN